MAARSRIKKLPPEIQAQLNRLLADDKLTHRQIVEHMSQLGVAVSKSSLGRYALEYKDFVSDIKFAREAMDLAGSDIADLPTQDKGRLLAESLQALIIRARMQLGQGEIDLDDVAKLSRSVKDVAQALKASVDTNLKVREKAKLLAEAADAAEGAAKGRGLSADAAAEIRAAILGIAQTVTP